MPRYQKVVYSKVAWAIRNAVANIGEDVLLLQVIKSIEVQQGLCLDPREVMKALGDRCEERVEQCGDIRRVSTWVLAH